MDDRSFSSALSPSSSMFNKSFNARASDGNSRGVVAATAYMVNGVPSSPYHSPRASPRVGSPRRPSDSFYGSPKKQGVQGGGVSTPLLSSPPKRPVPFGPSSVQQPQPGGEKHSKLVGGPGGGFGPGRASPTPYPETPVAGTAKQQSAGAAQQQERSGSGSRGTPTGLPGTASPAVGGAARGTYLALYAGSPARHGEKPKTQSPLH
jgi:hypothetical protein